MMANDSQDVAASVKNGSLEAAENQDRETGGSPIQQHEEFIKPDITSKELRVALDNTPARPRRFDLIRLQRKEKLASRAQAAAKSPALKGSFVASIMRNNDILGGHAEEEVADPPIGHAIDQFTKASANADLTGLETKVHQLSNDSAAIGPAQDAETFLQSPKRARDAAQEDLPDAPRDRSQDSKRDDVDKDYGSTAKKQRYLQINTMVDTSNANPEGSKLRRVRATTDSGRGSKKKLPRRLPDHSLVLMSERLGVSNSEADDDVQEELSDDQISQASVTIPRPRHLIRLSQSKIKSKPSGRKLGVKSPRYRFPKNSSRPPRSTRRFHTKAFHCDGFVGREADPTGRLMPLRHNNKRHELLARTTIRMNELILVSARPDERRSQMSNPGRKGGDARMPNEFNVQSQVEQSIIRRELGDGVIELDEGAIDIMCGETHAAPDFDTPIVRASSMERVVNKGLDLGGRTSTVSALALPGTRASAREEEPEQLSGGKPIDKILTTLGPVERQHGIKTSDILVKGWNHECPPTAPSAISSRLKKNSQTRRVSFYDQIGKGARANRVRSRTEHQQELTKPGRTAIAKLSPRNTERDHIRKTQDDLATSQRLMMVSLPSSSFHDSESDEEDSEEVESNEATDEEAEVLKRGTYVPLEDFGDDGDAEPEAQLSAEEDPDSLLQEMEDNVYNQRKVSLQIDDWRPRKPKAGNMMMEVDEDILDSPLASYTHKGRLSHGSKARRSFSACIPETQLVSHDPIEERLSQMSFIPQASYFERASQNLRYVSRELGARRTQSMLGTKHYFQQEEEREEEGAIFGSDRLAQTISTSPRKLSSPLPTLLQETPAQKKCLQTLTRQASIGLGTVPGSARRRLKSLPFTPPFLRSSG